MCLFAWIKPTTNVLSQWYLYIYKQKKLCYNAFILGVGEFAPKFGAKLCGKTAVAKGPIATSFLLQKGELWKNQFGYQYWLCCASQWLCLPVACNPNRTSVKTSAKLVANAQTKTVRKLFAQTSAKVTSLHTLARAFAPLATNVWMQPVRKVLARKSVLVTHHHTVVKTNAKHAVSVQTKTVLNQFAQTNAKVTFHHILVKTCANNVVNAQINLVLKPSV